MPLPNILEFIASSVTQTGFKSALQKLLDYLNNEVPTKTDINDALSSKAEKAYVDNALTSFANGASKYYPTLAAANADIANIMPKLVSDTVKDKVEVGEAGVGGVYYKATYNATSLTKSSYDPLSQAKLYTDEATKNIGQQTNNVLDESKDRNFNVYRYTDNDGHLFMIGLDGSVQNKFKSLEEKAKNIPALKQDKFLARFEDNIGRVFGYFDEQSNPHFIDDIYFAEKSLKVQLRDQDFRARYQDILMNKLPAIKALVPIAEKAEDNLLKRMPAAIKTPTGLVYFYHKQIAGYDGDNTGSELWKAIISIDVELNVTVVSRELFLSPDAPRGIVKHPMLGRTSDGRIILMYEKRLETSDFYKRYQCYSYDEGVTFTTPTLVTPLGIDPAGLSNSALGTTGTITTAKNNRLIVPMYTTGGACYCIYSDNNGENWTFSGWVNTSQVSGYEPSISLDIDDNLVMDVRPKTATYRLKAKSIDNGETWKLFPTQQIPTSTNQGVIFRDKDIGAMIQANDANQAHARTKFSLFISYDNAETFPLKYLPFSESWYGGYCQILKWEDGIYIVVMEYADSFIDVNTNENAGLLILSLKEVLSNVSRNYI